MTIFSNIGGLFKPTTRQTEHADTRQEIRREEKRDGRKKSEFDDRLSADLFGEDSTDVSIPALRMFLINFLKDGGVDVTNPAAHQTGDTPAPSAPQVPVYLEPANTATARAVGAYQSMSQKTSGYTPSLPPAPPQTVKAVDTLSANDIRVIYQLIADLEILSERGIETLHIEKAASFLESLSNGVNTLKFQMGI